VCTTAPQIVTKHKIWKWEDFKWDGEKGSKSRLKILIIPRWRKSRSFYNANLKYCKNLQNGWFGSILTGRKYQNNFLSKLKFWEKSKGQRFKFPLKGVGWKYRRKMRITNWIWDLFFGLFLVTGVYSVKPLVIPTLELVLEDLKNKLKSSAGTRNYGLGQKVSTEEFGMNRLCRSQGCEITLRLNEFTRSFPTSTLFSNLTATTTTPLYSLF